MKIIQLHQDEKQLIELAITQNRNAQHKIYTRFSPKMLSVCRQYIKDIHLAEEVMLTAFLKVFTSLTTFEFKGSFEGWIRRIVVNECISFVRKQKKVFFIEEFQFTEVLFEESDQDDEVNFSQEDLQFLIDALPDGYKMIFNLYVIEGYKHKDIAEMLSISEGTSKSQLSQARKALQNSIAKLKNSQYGTE